MFSGVFQFAVNREQHCDIAGGSSDKIGDGFCDKNAVDTETEQHWQADGQREDKDDPPRFMTTFRKIEKKMACLDLFRAI